MIMYKTWDKRNKGDRKRYIYEGWFLFGIIPLYIKRISCLREKVLKRALGGASKHLTSEQCRSDKKPLPTIRTIHTTA